MKLSDLKPNPKNPRTITKEMLEKLKTSIKDFEKMLQIRPMIVDENNVILGGNQRFNALQALKYEDIPDEWVKQVKDLTDAEKREFVIKDNVGFGAWDFEELANDYTIEELEAWGLQCLDKIEVEAIGGETDPDDVGDLPEEATVQLGDIYELGDHRLICGDATNIKTLEKLMDGKKANMVFTDPPYNVNYEGGLHGDGSQTKRKKIQNDKMSKEDFYQFLYDFIVNAISYTDGAFYICMSSSELHNLWKAFTDAGGHWQTYCIWAKHAFTLSRSDYQHQYEPIMYGLSAEEQAKISDSGEAVDSEPIMYGWSKHDWYGGRKQGDVWMFDRPTKSKEHPTMKPVGLCAKAIGNSSRHGQIILDLFGGSGSTLIACEQLKRKCYMIELEEKYCDVIIERWENFTGKKAKKL